MIRSSVRATSRLVIISSSTRPVLRATKLQHAFTRTNPSLLTRQWNSSPPKVDQQYMIAFTCKKCNTRSSHTFSKQAYTKGTVAIQCPGCKNRHLIADNLGVFKDNNFKLEDILKARGESVATGTDDLVFEDIPESLRNTLGHYAKDAPEEYRQEDKVHYLEDKKEKE